MDYSRIIERLCQNGFEAYIVGGAVRDMFMGKDAVDHAYPIRTGRTLVKYLQYFVCLYRSLCRSALLRVRQFLTHC